METIDRNSVKEINKAVEVALQEVAQRFGLNVKVDGGKFDPTVGVFFPKVEFSVEGSAKKDWEQSVHLLYSNRPVWLTGDDFGAQITYNGRKFELVGINLRAPKFPINAKCLADGKVYKLTEEGVKRAMGR